MPRRRVTARRWARKLGGHSPVNAALSGVFESISDGTYDCVDEAHACPLVDMSLGGKAYSKPRLPFLITEVVDGTHHVGDEFAHVKATLPESCFFEHRSERTTKFGKSASPNTLKLSKHIDIRSLNNNVLSVFNLLDCAVTAEPKQLDRPSCGFS